MLRFSRFILSVVICFVACLAANGHIGQFGESETITIRSRVLNETRSILIRTPHGYENADKRYPVLYVSDGESHLAHTAASVSFLARNNLAPEMIVIGITHTDRNRELTPTKVKSPNPHWDTSGNAKEFLEFIETEVIPAVERRYRTAPFRVFAGHSFGGLFAIYALLERPDLFNAYIAVSPVLVWDKFAVLANVEMVFGPRERWTKKVYISVGNEPGLLASVKRFEEIVIKYHPDGFELSTEYLTDEDHLSVVMRSHYNGLRRIFNGWRMPSIPNDLEQAEDYYKRLSESFAFDVPVPESTFAQIASKLLKAGNKDKAIEVLRVGVSKYPESATAYESLADTLERFGDLTSAITAYRKAYTLARKYPKPGLSNYKFYQECIDRLRSKAVR